MTRMPTLRLTQTAVSEDLHRVEISLGRFPDALAYAERPCVDSVVVADRRPQLAALGSRSVPGER
jgi:hypothetical protein